MATYFHNPNNESEATPMVYTRESWQGSNTNMMMYMNYLSSNEMPPPQQENEFSAWPNRSEMTFMPPMGTATSLLQGVQNLQGQGLSLSLSTQIQPTIQIPSIDFQNTSMGEFSLFSGTNNDPCNRLGDDGNSPKKQISGENMSNYGVPSVGRTLPNSKYLKAAQQLLDEVVNVRNALKKHESNEVTKIEEGVEGESKSETKSSFSSKSPNDLSAAEKQDLQDKLSKLLTMLDEVDKRYKQYYHQMQIVASSFDMVSSSGAAKPYTALALQTISCHFRCLRDAITKQIRIIQKSLGENESSENSKGVTISRLRYIDQQAKQQRAMQQLGMIQQHAWRPQRGLPENSVSILRAWLFEHFLHPYPKDSEKLMLSRQTGLTKSQVSNWFINARVRLWKPMVEEMYKEEIGDAEANSTSSPETENKGIKGDIKPSDDINNQELEQSTNSAQQCNNDSNHGLVSSMETTRSGNSAFQNETDHREEIRPCLDENGFFQGYQMPGFGIYGRSNGVSLTLGLQHCEGGSLPISVDNQNFAIYNTEFSSVGPETADFDMDSKNRQHRYGSSHLFM